ncbi:cupin domain-containing protein [Streptomyces sp. NPDC048636]|uniref:cupin domain-containing protein n=1 Tax=Streptomyces sp. NPDC048636 TaxID=3155762 RepID=UPI003440A5D4
MLEVKTIDKPDERRDFPGGHLDTVHLTGLDFAVGVFEPGWRWKESVRPIAGTYLCEVHHTGFVAKGRMRLRMADGAETEVGPGDVFVCPPGHDAWVVGDEQVVVYDFAGAMAESYAKAERRGNAEDENADDGDGD